MWWKKVSMREWIYSFILVGGSRFDHTWKAAKNYRACSERYREVLWASEIPNRELNAGEMNGRRRLNPKSRLREKYDIFRLSRSPEGVVKIHYIIVVWCFASLSFSPRLFHCAHRTIPSGDRVKMDFSMRDGKYERQKPKTCSYKKIFLALPFAPHCSLMYVLF